MFAMWSSGLVLVQDLCVHLVPVQSRMFLFKVTTSFSECALGATSKKLHLYSYPQQLYLSAQLVISFTVDLSKHSRELHIKLECTVLKFHLFNKLVPYL